VPGLPVRHDSGVRRYKIAVLCAGLGFAAGGIALLIHFFVSQGLTTASLWATILSFGLAALGTSVAVWTLVLMIRQDGQSASQSSNDGQQRFASTKQVNSTGSNIIHSGQGDINYSGPGK
jgi:hypothetical protein